MSGLSNRGVISYFKKNWEFKIAFFIVAYYFLTNIVLESAHSHQIRGLSNNLRVVPDQVIKHYDQTVDITNAKKYAYVQYATSYEYLNLAVINFIVLRESGSKIKNLVILYDSKLQQYSNNGETPWTRLSGLSLKHHITLKPVKLLQLRDSASTSWASSFTKFHIFNLVEYDRVVYFDSDSMLVNTLFDEDGVHTEKPSNLDELFKIPKEITYVLPQAYWLNNIVEDKGSFQNKYNRKVTIPTQKQYGLRMQKLVNDIKDLDFADAFTKLPALIYERHKHDNRDDFFANHVMVLTPSREVFTELLRYIHNPFHWRLFKRSRLRKQTDYDMEILNKYLDDELKSKSGIKVGILPHRTYGVLTGEFKEKWHRRFVAEPEFLPFIDKHSNKDWNSREASKHIKLVHFSDSPIPKPWEFDSNLEYYNRHKIWCSKDDTELYLKTYPTEHKPKITDDCDSVRLWDYYRDQFRLLKEKYWVLDF